MNISDVYLSRVEYYLLTWHDNSTSCTIPIGTAVLEHFICLNKHICAAALVTLRKDEHTPSQAKCFIVEEYRTTQLIIELASTQFALITINLY